MTSGVARADASAPRTTKPRVSETCTLIANGCVRVETGLGENRTPSTTRRAGSETLVTGIDVLPLASLICPSGPEAAVVVGVVVVVTEVVVGAVVVEIVLVSVDVDSVEVDPVVLDVVVAVVVSAAGPSGLPLPTLAK